MNKNVLSKAMLVALRIAIGWHFLYEGVWKLNSDTGATAYATSWYTLHSAVARLENELAAAPPEAANLAPALSRVDAWYDDLVKAFKARKPLDEAQKAKLAELRDEVKLALAGAAKGELAPSAAMGFSWQYVRDEVLGLAAAQEGERFSSLAYLQSASGPFRSAYRALVPDIDGLERLTAESAKSRLDERYGQILRHFERAGMPFDAAQQRRLAAARGAVQLALMQTLAQPSFAVRVADYRRLRERVAQGAGPARTAFARERLAADRQKLDTIAAELLGFVNEPLAELDVQAQNIATPKQMSAGPFPRPGDPARNIDLLVEWALVAIGVCLMAGLFTPVAGVAAALQLGVFYFAAPPWPGLPAATLGGHYLYVDRNLIEAIAAAAVAFTNSGAWAGLDAYILRWRERSRGVAKTEIQEEAAVAAAC